MNYSGNMPDWQQYHSPQPIGSEVPSAGGQNVNHSPIFGPSISPRRLNGSSFSPEGLTKPQNDANYNSRNFQQSPNTLNGHNVPPENPPIGATVLMSGCHRHYGTPSPRNTMIEGTNASLDSRNVPVSSMNEVAGQRNHQIPMNGPAGHMSCPTISGPMAPMGQRNTPTALQAPIPTSSRQGPGSYMPCKGPCCNPDTSLSYQSWEKFGPYPPNVPYRSDTGYSVDNRRFGNEFETREPLSTTAYNVDPRRNFPDYKYRKDSIIQRPYAHPPSVIQSYPVQNYNFTGDYQKYPGYPVKEYPRDNSITNSQNPAILKYQEQSVIVQQKYFTKQIQYQNGVIPKSIVPANMGGNIISRGQNPYFNPPLARDFPRDYSDSNSLVNKGIQTPNAIHPTYSKYQMYQQKIAMQRFSMENHMQELTRIPGYQSHPKYQECILRHKELLRLQQNVDYQSIAQGTPRAVTSQVNDDIPPINLQFDQNGVLINSTFAPAGFSNLQSPINVRNAKNIQSVSNREIGAENVHHPEQFKTQSPIDNHIQSQVSSSLSQCSLPCKNEESYSVQKEFKQDQYNVKKPEREAHNVSNIENDKTSSILQRNSSDFADKPELDVRQFLANWDESEDEDAGNGNLPDAVSSNSTSSVVPEYENTKVVLDNSKEPANSSNVQDCQSTDDCERFEDTQNNRKSSNYTENEIYKYDLQHDGDSSKSSEQDFDTSDSSKSIVTDETEIQSTGSDYKGETELHVTEKLLDCQDIHTSTKVQCQEKKSLNNNDSQEISNSMEVDIMVPKKSTQKETITTIKEHIETHKFDSTVDIRSDIEEAIESDNNSRSSYSGESSDNKEDHFSSNGDVSESSNGKSMNSHSISSVIKLPKTIKGTEIHIDAQELAAIPVSPKSNSEVLEGSDLQKQNSFVNEESHNPDDISLPDLPTSECTPISTTLNTPIHSDSEESLDPVIDLTIPTNPIEIIQNSPMLSFTHSPIKMEPYEHFEENDFTGKLSQDAMEFDFHANNSCDNDFEKLTDVSSHTTEQYNVAQSNEETFDSDCIEVLSEKAVQKVVGNMHKLEIKEIVADSNVAKNFSVDQSQFSFSKENAVTTNETNSNMGDTDCEAWSLVTVKDREHHISNATNHQDEKNDIDKLQTLSEFGNKLSERLKGTKSNFEESAVQAPTDKNHYGISRWQIRCETDDEVTALNLVKDETKVNSDSKKMTDRVTTSQVVNCEEISFKSSNNRNCDSSVESKQLFTSLEHTDLYSSSSEEDTIYTENTENQQHFSSSSTIPLIPGEYSEEPKIPVLPMEGNCLTKIIKNTSPITDLDVLGSDDEKLEKIDELWMEVGGVETVDKVIDVNTDCCTVRCKITDCEKILDLRNKQRKLQSSECKRLKHSVKTKDVSNSFGRIWDNSKEMELKSNTSKNTRLDETCSLNAVQQKIAPVIDKVRTDCSINTGTQNAIEILPEQHTLSKPPIDSKPTSSKFFYENDHLTHNICAESNVTEIMKCQEKANHVNDIATKLLENARLIEPESKKTEILRKDSFCTNNISDTSKKRIKLLKEYRKMKSTVNTDSAGNQSRKTEDDINSNIVSSTDIVEECKAIVVADVAKVNIEVVKNSKKNTVQEVSKEFNCLRQNINLDTAVSPDIIVPEEKYRKILYHGERAVLNKDRQIDNDYYVNMEANITVENSGTTNSSKTLNTMVVNLFDKDTNECAINLSKSSTDYDLLHTLHEDDCLRSDNHNSCVSEDIARDEIREIKSGGNEEKKFALSGTAYAADNPLYTQMVEKDNDTLDKNNIKACNAVEDNGDSNITSAPARLTEECTLKEHNMHEIDQQSIEITADGSQLEKFSPIPQKIQKSIECSKNSEEIINNFFVCEKSIAVSESESGETTEFTSKQNGISALNESVAENEVHNEEHVTEIIDREVACDLQNAHRDVVSDSSFVNNEKLMKSVSNFDQSTKSSSSNHAREEETTVQNHQNLLPCRTNLLKAGNTESIENCIDTSPCQEIKNVCTFLSEKVEEMECEPSIVSDSSIIVKKDVIDDIRKESLMMNEDAECKRNSLNLNKPLPEISFESTKSGNSQYSILNDINLPLGTDRSMETISTSLEAFGFENSFNYDFNNFDVAPNIDEVVENDQSNTWKYSKAHSRFEDCERYKNPDNCISPILASLECLDNLNTVPIYTTKDGKITYSPNPKFTYRALIMEAREREGYSDTRDSYCRNSRTPENLGYPKNQTSFRKRKSSNGYRHSGGYTKKHYLDHYEPKEHGESSTNNLTEPWNKSYFSRNKYRHQPRDRKSHHFLHHNLDSQKKHDTQKIAQEISSSKYTLREGCTNLEDHYKQKNGTANSFKWKNRREFEQSTEQSVPVSVLLRNTQDLNGYQNPGDFAQPKQSTSTTSIKKFKNCEKRGSIEENVCDLQHGDQSKDPHKKLTQKLASGSDQHKPVSGCTTNLVSLRLEPSTSSHPQYIENKKMDLKVKELELSFPKLRYKSFNDQYLSEIPNSKLSKDLNDESEINDQYLSEIPNRKLSEDLNDESETNEIDSKENKTNMLYDHVDELKENSENVVQRKNCLVIDIPITKSLFDETQEVDHKKNEANVLYDQVDEWKGSCGRLAVHCESFFKTDVPKETLLDKTNEVHHEENKENMLCDRNDDIYKSRTSNISKNKLIDSIPLESECIIAPESVKSAETIETLEELDHNLENLKSVKDKAIINISHIEDETCLTPVQVILANKNSDAPKVAEISEIENKSGPKMSSNAGIQNLSEEAKSNQLLNKADVQTSSVFVVHCSSESQDVDQENTFNEDRNIDNRLELKSADSIDDVQGNLVSVKSNDNIFRCPEESDSSQSEQNHLELAKMVSAVESNEITSKNENGMLVKDCAKEQVDSHIIKMKCEYENIAKSQPQFENYVTYSPLSESPEDPKVIPKLVIKKTDSLSCKNICLTSTILLQDLGAEKILGKDVKNSKASPHPKIPKILIRNAKSRPSTPSIEEISDEKLSSSSTKEDNKSHKVKIRSEETRSTSPTAASHANNLHTDIIESKIPKMKIKLEDRSSKVIIENVITEFRASNEDVQKIIPKMKIKKLKGTLRQVVDTKILPVSIPRMCIYTELENKKQTRTITREDENEPSTLGENLTSVAPNSILSNKKSMNDIEFKRIPKLKIKRQSLGCTVELNRKRYNASPVQSEPKKIKKSLKQTESNDKKLSSKLPLPIPSEYLDSPKKQDSSAIGRCHQLNCSEMDEYASANDSCVKIKNDQVKSTKGKISVGPKEIPKVIIKRTSPSAEFKCELSKGRRDAIILNKMWQPEVKLQRSWVLDCMAKDLNLNNLKLKLATPDSLRKKSLLQKRTEQGQAMHVANDNVNKNCSKNKLFRSKSTSDLVSERGHAGTLVDYHNMQQKQTSTANLPIQSSTRKRCKSDVGSIFTKHSENSKCDKKLKYDYDSHRIQLIPKHELNCKDNVENSSNIQSIKECQVVTGNHENIWDPEIKSEKSCAFQNHNEPMNPIKTFKIKPEKTLDENMNSKSEHFVLRRKPLLNDKPLDKAVIDLNLNSKILTNNSTSNFECSKNDNEIVNIIANCFSATGKQEVLEDTTMTKNATVNSLQRHMKIEINTTETRPTIIEDRKMDLTPVEIEILKNKDTSCDEINQVRTVIDDINIRDHPITLPHIMSVNPDVNISKKNSENCFYKNSINAAQIVDSESIDCSNNISKLYNTDNSDEDASQGDNQNHISENLILDIAVEQQRKNSVPNENVLNKPIDFNSISTDLSSEYVQNPEIDTNLNSSLDNADDSDEDSVIKAESFETTQATSKPVSTSPSFSRYEMEIPSYTDTIKDNEMCLYSEDAIPTQYELELELTDTLAHDSSEVPIPETGNYDKEVPYYSQDDTNENSHQLPSILSTFENIGNLNETKSESTTPDNNENNFSKVRSIKHQEEPLAYPDDEDTISCTHIGKLDVNNDGHMESAVGHDRNIEESSCNSDSLVKEVLAAKETLKKCLAKNKDETRFKLKSRPKTAAEKKQGLSFDVSALPVCNESLTMLSTLPNGSELMDQNFDTTNKNKFLQIQTKTKLEINTNNLDRKHSKGSRHESMQRKYSNFPPNELQRNDSITQVKESLISKHSSIDNKGSIELAEDDMTISLKNSKYLMKKKSFSDTHKKIPELMNSKDNKCRSKMLKHDLDAKYVGKSKIGLENITLQESSTDFIQCKEKLNTSKPKYKSLKILLDQNVKSVKDKTKFKFYKIPKLTKPTHRESQRLTEEVEESQRKEARMPILEPQVDINMDLDIATFNFGREMSRSPPVITIQESLTHNETATSSSRDDSRQVSSNKEKEVLSKQGIMFADLETPEAMLTLGKGTTVADIVNDMAYHEKAIIKHKRYCTLCERWFPTVTRYRRHLSGYQHRHTELTQRRTIHALFTLFTGKLCPRLQPPGVVRIDCGPGELTPLQIAVQGVTKESSKMDNNIEQPTSDDK
ncbi:uncharacterized protein LOC124411827 [Diprion similis]|uniref:uncharacterized protein LOC124411827 n=1 Tax=Diprion similis TaxID=362088 RepID=UPI001EF9AFDC|nr:uncharacterized protein LOC124411827 [Diprion similis]XP_046747259.1 uncharacterized protein LOC124411827 [Diprion similis]